MKTENTISTPQQNHTGELPEKSQNIVQKSVSFLRIKVASLVIRVYIRVKNMVVITTKYAR